MNRGQPQLDPHTLVDGLLPWFAQNARDLPWRRTLDPYAIWISEIMLQQTQVATVIPYWERWMRELPDVPALANAPEARVLKLWEGLGYYSRARNLQRAARTILDVRSGKFPTAFEQILDLPGIGRYTAGAICSVAFDQPTPIVDGNVIRVLTRIYGIRQDPRARLTNDRLWSLAAELVAAADLKRKEFSRPCSALNQALMELGALVCAPKNPRCDTCPAANFCRARQLKIQDRLPNISPRAATTQRHFFTYLLKRKRRWLVRQRPTGVVNAGFWEFPSVEVADFNSAPDAILLKELGITTTPSRTGSLKHSITRYRITQHVFHAEVTKELRPLDAARWVDERALDEIALTGAHRKIARRFLPATG